MEESLPFSEPFVAENGWQVADLLRAAGMPATGDHVDSFIDSGVPNEPFNDI